VNAGSVPERHIRDILKRTGIAAGVAAGVGGAVYLGERLLARRQRHRDDSDVDDPLVPIFDEAIRVDCHDGGSLYAITRGAGRPMLFAHGVTLSSRLWAKQFASLPTAGFRTIAFDSRGHGESTVGETGHSIDNLADDVRSVIEFLDLHDVVLVGHSMGGMALQSFAVRFPDITRARVSGLVLMSTSARAITSDARRVRSGLERATAAVPNVGAVMRQRNLGLLMARFGFGDAPDPSYVEATRQMLAACSRATMRDASRALLSLDVTPGLPSVMLPTLVLVGTADLLTPPRDARLIASLVPNARLVELTGAGHMLMYERADEVDRLLIEFANETARPETDTGSRGRAVAR
jgi:pimeloyl-ACP methyl ester carboxylesterase